MQEWGFQNVIWPFDTKGGTYAVFGAMQRCNMSHAVYLQAITAMSSRLSTMLTSASAAAPWKLAFKMVTMSEVSRTRSPSAAA